MAAGDTLGRGAPGVARERRGVALAGERREWFWSGSKEVHCGCCGRMLERGHQRKAATGYCSVVGSAGGSCCSGRTGRLPLKNLGAGKPEDRCIQGGRPLSTGVVDEADEVGAVAPVEIWLRPEGFVDAGGRLDETVPKGRTVLGRIDRGTGTGMATQLRHSPQEGKPALLQKTTTATGDSLRMVMKMDSTSDCLATLVLSCENSQHGAAAVAVAGAAVVIC
ncbi:hypothetical protein MLD38_005236 [Melastoma candidum]|uniref:Uncharacterized protein n=1 Tax=Melastoma candidum TaxID=119954 RepID=A0ACB9S9R6_9MYRT|nr:hypothetical protein MLD38_005236 [Melastoma candidum]